jgi:RNA recognition motif-containing protein
VARDKWTGRRLGYGFLRYATEEQAAAAIEGVNGFQIACDGEIVKTLKVSFARPSSQAIQGCKLYIANFPSRMPEQDISELLGQVMCLYQFGVL